MEIGLYSKQEDFREYDLYFTLNLDEEEVRKQPLPEQDRVITKAFRKHIRVHHPDRQGDIAWAQQITNAYNVLKRRQDRALYHDLTDFRRSLTGKWKAIICPESGDKNEKLKRRLLFAGSCLLMVGGLALSIGTAGLALPVVLGCSVAVGACCSAGAVGAKRIFAIETVENGLDTKKFLKSVLIAASIGSFAGLATAGIGVALSEVLTFGVAEFSFLDNVIDGLPGDAINGSFFSMASDIVKKVVDKKHVTARDFVFNAVHGAFINMSLSGQLRNFLDFFKSILDLVSSPKFSIPDKWNKHALSMIKIAKCIFTTVKPESSESDDEPGKNDGSESYNGRSTRNQFSTEKFSIPDKWKNRAANVVKIAQNIYTTLKSKGSNNGRDGEVSYVSKGLYFTKMIVKYKCVMRNGEEEKTYEVKGSGKTVKIPAGARNIKVSFKVMRFIAVWCDVKKWDRCQGKWVKKTQPHIFEFDNPVRFKFTLDGSLYFEGIVKISDSDCQLVHTEACSNNINDCFMLGAR